MNEAQSVQCIQCERNFGQVKSRQLLVERSMTYHEPEQIAAWQIFHDQVQIFAILKRELKLRDPLGLSTEDHDVALLLNPAIAHRRFLDGFHCENIVRGFLGDKLS